MKKTPPFAHQSLKAGAQEFYPTGIQVALK
jgi:hypothetical protein